MQLPVMPPVSPMLAKSVPEVPEGDFLFEPKWDYFWVPTYVFRIGVPDSLWPQGISRSAQAA